MCTSTYHVWMWSSSSTAGQDAVSPPGVRCMCGLYTRQEWASLTQKVAALEAENARLRDALELIERKTYAARLGLLWKGPQWTKITEAMEAARAALAASAGETG